MNKIGDKEIWQTLLKWVTRDWKIVCFITVPTMLVVIGGLVWLNAGARRITSAEWTFAGIIVGLLILLGCYLVKRNHDKEMVTRKLLYGKSSAPGTTTNAAKHVARFKIDD